MIKNKFYSILPVYLAFSLVISGYLANNNYKDILLQEKPPQANNKKIEKKEGVLVGGVSVTKDLPHEFYGTWSVVSVLVDTNNPALFKMRSSDIWTFDRKGDVITLSNPVNGVSASITINDVSDKTATFTRVHRDENTYETETPEITVEGDSFHGTDLIIIKHFRNGERVKTDRVKYKVKGYRISGPTLKDIFAR